MTFREFWPLYLKAHRLPGTRALHYFATAIGILGAVEAVASGQPLVFILGIAISYALAIAAHWHVEHNQPLIRVNAFWGAVADLRMCFLALTGQMAREMTRHGILQKGYVYAAEKPDKVWRGEKGARYALLFASAAGLSAGLVDLRDLRDPAEIMRLPIVQLGAPILAFAGALLSILAASVAAARYSTALSGAIGQAKTREKALSGAMGGIMSAGYALADQESLRRACLALLAAGFVAFAAAELTEHGILDAARTLGAVVALSSVGLALAWRLAGASPAKARRGTADEIAPGRRAATTGPRTRGVRVDGRANLVDALENMLSLGRRRAILAATLSAAELHPGDRLVDVGCGTGELVLRAALLGAGRSRAVDAIGIDATPGMIEIARRRARELHAAARFELAVAEALPLAEGSAQAVTSSFFFHHLPSDVKREALREMWRVLAPGGRLVITDYGWARGIPGKIASFPMRFNYHEFVRGQLGGELERIIEAEGLGAPETVRVYLGYIRVLRIVKHAPAGPADS